MRNAEPRRRSDADVGRSESSKRSRAPSTKKKNPMKKETRTKKKVIAFFFSNDKSAGSDASFVVLLIACVSVSQEGQPVAASSASSASSSSSSSSIDQGRRLEPTGTAPINFCRQPHAFRPAKWGTATGRIRNRPKTLRTIRC